MLDSLRKAATELPISDIQRERIGLLDARLADALAKLAIAEQKIAALEAENEGLRAGLQNKTAECEAIKLDKERLANLLDQRESSDVPSSIVVRSALVESMRGHVLPAR